MSTYSILHITDAHFGQAGMSGRWPTIKAQFFSDLRHVAGLTGGIDLVVFTGDIANRGAVAEYDQASKFLDELGNFLLEICPEIPRFAAVPGNHDLVRPASTALAKAALERSWNPDFERDLFENIESGDLREFARSLFNNYANWIDGTNHALTPIALQHRGVLPGDFAGTDVSNGIKVGIIGLNSTFRHLSDQATEGSLSISAMQAQQAAGGDLPAWSLQNDVTIALTHHPMSWMGNALDVEDAVFNGESTTRLHLCGHLHLERYSAQGIGTQSSRLTHQGQSLFGLQQFQGPEGLLDRQHGYAVITVEKSENQFSTTVWPRRGVQSNDGTWVFDKHAEFGLPKGLEHSQPFSFTTPSKPAPSIAPPVGSAPAAVAQNSRTKMEEAEKAFNRELKRGTLVAVIGDRYIQADGEGILAFGRLRAALWSSLETSEPIDESMSTDQILYLASEHSKQETNRILDEALFSSQPLDIEQLDKIIRSPWASVIYLSPIADLESCNFLSSQTDQMQLVDGTSAPYRIPVAGKRIVLRLASAAGKLNSTVLHLDEVLAHSPENSSADWRRYTKRLLSRSPSVFITDSVLSLSFWRWIADRNSSDDAYRLNAFLVCPELPAQYVALLDRYDVKWIKYTVEDFTEKYLKSSREEYVRGKQALQNRIRQSMGNTPLAIGALRALGGEGSREYLFGSNPSWGDMTSGFAARLSSQSKIIGSINSADERSMILVTGTAGSGRTTCLMQCALDLQASHKNVAWIDPTVGREKISQIIDQVIEEDYDYIFVDDVDAFGAQAERLLLGLRGGQTSKRIVIAGVRTVRRSLIGGLSFTHTLEVGNLTSDDLDSIVRVLRKHRAMADRRQSDHKLRQLLSSSNGQLIVGMIQATSGLPFVEKISSECSQLPQAALIMYGCVALVTAENEAISAAQLQDAVGGNENDSWGVLKSLEHNRLIQLKPNTMRYEVRHRVVAEEVRSHLSKVGALSTVTGGVLWAYAAAAALTKDKSDHVRRMLIRFLNHSYLIRTLGLPEPKIRSIYDSVEEILEDDFHYWLQRGAFEVEIGDLKNAMHDLTSATTTVGGEDDYKVLTEFAVLRLKIAVDRRNSDAVALAVDAVTDLHKVIRTQGIIAPHAFTTLASAGVPWLKDAVISRSEKKTLLEESLQALQRAGSLLTTNLEVSQKVPPAVQTLKNLLDES